MPGKAYFCTWVLSGMERLIQGTSGRMEKYVSWRVGRQATDMRMQKKPASCLTANSQDNCAVIGCLRNGEACTQKGTKQNPMCFYRFLRILGLSRWTKLPIRKATWERRKEVFPEIRDGPAAIWSVQAVNLESYSPANIIICPLFQLWSLKSKTKHNKQREMRQKIFLRAQSTLEIKTMLLQSQTPETRPSVLTSEQ